MAEVEDFVQLVLAITRAPPGVRSENRTTEATPARALEMLGTELKTRDAESALSGEPVAAYNSRV